MGGRHPIQQGLVICFFLGVGASEEHVDLGLLGGWGGCGGNLDVVLLPKVCGVRMCAGTSLTGGDFFWEKGSSIPPALLTDNLGLICWVSSEVPPAGCSQVRVIRHWLEFLQRIEAGNGGFVAHVCVWVWGFCFVETTFVKK